MHGASHEILGRLAVGGMAELYLARTTHHDGTREIVVLKRILPHLAEDPEFVRMFRDEAFLAATLDHPNIVHVHDIGQDGEDYFFTMEYVHGENVRTLIKEAQKQETTLPVEFVVHIAKGVCEGLHYAHEQNDEDGSPLRIVHRDVSPTNILVSSDGEIKIVDFGIAKAAAATHVTQAGMLKGKASYMSPEQCRAEPVDRRSDVFAIGILIYEMTTLTRLFRGDNELAVLHQILTGTVEPPSTRVDEYDAELERIVMCALAQKPDGRYPTALALKEALEEFEELRGLSASNETVGVHMRELCGEKPFPWDEGDDEPLEPLDQSGTGTGMPTSLGNFDDDEDTQVNRKAPDLRTMVPGAPSGWTNDKVTGSPSGWTNKPPPRTDKDVPPGLAGSKPASPHPAGPAAARTAAAKPAPARAQAAVRGLNRDRPRLSGAPRGMGIPPSTVSTAAPPGRTDPRAESTAPMTQPGIARTPTPRPGRRLPAKAPRPPGSAKVPGQPPGSGAAPRRGSTLAGAGGGLAGPLPARSGRTVPGGAQSKAPTPSPSSRPLASPPPDAGPRPRTPQGGQPPQHAAGAAAPQPPPKATPPTDGAGLPGGSDRTEALTPEQARELKRLGAALSPPGNRPAPASRPPAPSRPDPIPKASDWSGPGVDRTELAPSIPDDIDEGARTLALPRFDRTMLAAPGQDFSQEIPQGPMNWGDGQDPLTQTQKSPVRRDAALPSLPKSIPSTPARTTTQQANPHGPILGPGQTPGQALTSTQRSASAAYPNVASAAAAAASTDLRRPEMRSPSPRPASTPRSLWVPILIVLIVGLAGTAVWLWLSSASAKTSSALERSPSSPIDSDATPNPSAHAPTVVAPTAEPSERPPTEPAPVEPSEPEPTETAIGAGVPPPPEQPLPTGAEASPSPGVEPATAEPPRRTRRPRQPSSQKPSPSADLPEIKPGRPVPP